MRRFVLACTFLLALVAGCGRDDAGSGSGSGLTVVATTQHVADFAREVGGDRVDVVALVPANADPHDFEPKPSDARAVAEADVVLRSGGEVDEWLGGLLENAGGDAEQVTLIDTVRTIEDDPHWWQDPRNVVRAAGAIEGAFAAADADGRAVYERNARAYAREVRALDERIASCMSGVDGERRKLVTNHDAFAYFAERYDIEILGSIIPARSTSAQPSAGDVRELVRTIRREDVTTIFPESALSRRLEDAVARDAGVEVGEPLYADTLGPGDDGTYLEALRHDARLIAASFGADCDA
jgi:ABC-type Zn uptake system ZnuABC Zn-binding protein ZnuA